MEQEILGKFIDLDVLKYDVFKFKNNTRFPQPSLLCYGGNNHMYNFIFMYSNGEYNAFLLTREELRGIDIKLLKTNKTNFKWGKHV